MQGEAKSKAQLIDEVKGLRRRVAELERDPVDRNLVEEALKEADERFRVIFHNLRDGLLLADKETKKFLLGNPAMHEMLGCSAEELEHLEIKDIHPEQDLPWILERFDQLVRREIEVARDVPVRRKDGRVLYVDISCSFPIVFKGREYLMGAFRDVTERRATEEALREGEAGYRNIFENATEGIFQSTFQGSFLRVNPALARMMGYASQEEMLTEVKDLSRQVYVHPEDRERLRALVTERGRVGGYEVQFYHREGTIIWVSINVRTVRDATGAILYYEGTVQDITRRKEAEAALALAGRYNRSLIEASPDSFFIIDFTGNIADVNTAAEKATGYSRGHLTGTGFCDHFTNPENAMEGCEKTIREGLVRDCELELHHAGGAVTPVLLNANVFGDESDPARGIFAAIRDISLRRRMEDALRHVNEHLETLVAQRTAELEEKTRHLEEMNSALKVVLKQRELDKRELEDHILRNIKTLVLPYLENLKKNRSPGDQANYLRILESNLEEVTSPFRATLAGAFAGLTPMEIRVANLIQEGLKTKEIAQLLECSRNTVQAHRFNLRKKLKLLGHGANLRVFLGTLR
jgi:PAS domain S-box-containing protein